MEDSVNCFSPVQIGQKKVWISLLFEFEWQYTAT